MKESFTSSCCRASVEKEHYFHEHHPALLILSAMKGTKKGEQWHLIDGGLRRKNLRQWKASRTSSSQIWDARENSPTVSGQLRGGHACPLHFTSPLSIFPIHFPLHSLVYLCEVRERSKDYFLFSIIYFYFIFKSFLFYFSPLSD